MVNRKSLLSLLVAASTALTLSTASAADVTLKMHQFLPPQANVPKLVLDVWADKVEADSKGKIKVNRFPSMQLGGKPPQLMAWRISSGQWSATHPAATQPRKCLNYHLW